MAGVKVTMQRVKRDGINPVERLFEDADAWAFAYERNISSLLVMVNNPPHDDGSFDRKTIAEFPAIGVESVEFA